MQVSWTGILKLSKGVNVFVRIPLDIYFLFYINVPQIKMQLTQTLESSASLDLWRREKPFS